MLSKNLSTADENNENIKPYVQGGVKIQPALIPPVTTYEMKNQAAVSKMTTE